MTVPPPVRYLVLFVTGACNLRCRYCYAAGAAPDGPMPFSVASRALELAASSGKRFHVQLTGGEPTLAPSAVEAIVSYVRRRQMAATIGLQTNGTLLDDTLLALVIRHRVDVGLSIDGIESVHNAARGLFKETLRGLAMLEEREIPCQVTAVVTEESAPHLDKLALLLAGFPNVRGLGLDLLVRRGNALSSGISPVSPAVFEKAVASLRLAVAFVNANRSVPLTVRELHRTDAASVMGCHAAAGASLAVLPDGRLFPCSQTAGDPAFALGDLSSGVGIGRRRLVAGPDCPSRTYYNRGSNLPLCRLLLSERMS